jgi:hypothetical protein
MSQAHGPSCVIDEIGLCSCELDAFAEGWKYGYDAGLADAENAIAEVRWERANEEPKPDGFLGAPK